MSIEVGIILDGKISGITNFGVFVDLEDGQTGLVHISEISHTYVEQIKDFVEVGQEVKVKVISIADNGKVALSMKQTVPKEAHKKAPFRRRERVERPPAEKVTNPGEYEWQAVRRTSDNSSFEDMMSKFKQHSEDKISDLKRGGESRGYSRRGRK